MRISRGFVSAVLPAVIWACSSDAELPASSPAVDGGGISATPTIDSGVSVDGSVVPDKAADASMPALADPCATLPALPASLPDVAHAGVPAGVKLTPSKDLVVNTAGAVIEALDLTGGIIVAAKDVTIKNCKIHTKGGPNDIAIKVEDGITGTRILHSEIYTEEGGYIGILAADTVVCASYLHGWENAMTLGGGMMVQANFIEKLASGQPGAHFDGIEVYSGGAPSRLWGNHIRMTDPKDKWLDETGAINLTAYQGAIDDVEMNGNFLGGGSYTVYVDEQNGDKATNVKITNNRFYKGTAAYGTHLIRREASVTAFTGNTLDDGTAIEK